jgi:hypothetical protein
LQADEDADRLQDGGFAAGVVTNEDETLFRRVELQGTEAAEVLEAEMLDQTFNSKL